MTWTSNTVDAARRRTGLAMVAVAAVLVATMSPAQASDDSASDDSASDDSVIEQQIDIGFFYGTFFEQPNTFVMVGGAAEEFCVSDPGTAEAKTWTDATGAIHTTVDESDQPVYAYKANAPDLIEWLDGVCADHLANGTIPVPFAVGEGELDVHDTFHSPDFIELFNEVRGEVTTADGEEFDVFGQADFTVRNGMPTTSPDQFVSFSLTPKEHDDDD